MGKADLQLHRADDWRSRRGHGPVPGSVHEGLSRTRFAQGPRSLFLVAVSDRAQHVLFEAQEGPGKNLRRASTGNKGNEDAYRKSTGSGKGVAGFTGRSTRSRGLEGVSKFEI